MTTTPNRFPGSCIRCGTHHASGQGQIVREDGKWQVYCLTLCQPVPVAQRTKPVAEQVGDLSGIMALFAKARAHLKFPAIVIDVPEIQGLSIRINVAGARAKEPGSLTVVEGERDDMGQRDWLGRVSLNGTWQPGRDPRAAVIGRRLREFAADPARVASEYGKLTGNCCFCRKALSDERSTAVGYGKICAGHFGLEWGGKPAEFAGPARAA